MFQRAVYRAVTGGGTSAAIGAQRLYGLVITVDFPYAQVQIAQRPTAPVGDPAATFPPIVRQPDFRYFQPTWSPRLWVQAQYRLAPVGDPPAAFTPLPRPFAANYPKALSTAYWTRQARVTSLTAVQVIPATGILILTKFAPSIAVFPTPKPTQGAGWNARSGKLQPWQPQVVRSVGSRLWVASFAPDVRITDRGVWVWPDNGQSVVITLPEPQLLTTRAAILSLQTFRSTVEVTTRLSVDDVLLMLSQGWIDDDEAITLLATL